LIRSREFLFMMNPCRRAESGIFLGVWLFLMVGGRSRLFRDPGTFWHTVVGRRIFSSGCFFDTDPFTFTFPGRPWIPHQWLGECLMAVLDGIGGLDTLLLATATILACLYTWAAHRLIRGGLHWLPTACLIMLSISASANHLHVRPHISTIVFLGLTFGWFCDFEAGRIGTGRLCWLIPIFWVWSNMHGGALGGLATMGMVLAGWSLARTLGWDSPVAGLRQALILALLVLGCGVTAVVNPYGPRLPRAWLEIMGSQVVSRTVQEHAPLDFRSPDGLTVILLGLAWAATLGSVRPWRPRVTWLIPLFWLAQAVMRVRHGPLFAITATLAIAEMLPQSRLAAWLAQPGRDLFRFGASGSGQQAAGGGRRFDWRPAVIPVSVMLLALVLQAAGIRAPVLGRGWVRLDPAQWPVALLPELRRIEREDPPGTRILNVDLFGGFLIYHTPGLAVFMDDRFELYGDDWLMQYWEATQSHPERIELWEQAYGFPYALVARGTPFDHYLGQSRMWCLVNRTDTAALYRRREREPGPQEERP
jgi:hypothetical protein